VHTFFFLQFNYPDNSGQVLQFNIYDKIAIEFYSCYVSILQADVSSIMVYFPILTGVATSLPGGTARYFQSITKIISFAKTQASTKIKKYFIILPEQ